MEKFKLKLEPGDMVFVRDHKGKIHETTYVEFCTIGKCAGCHLIIKPTFRFVVTMVTKDKPTFMAYRFVYPPHLMKEYHNRQQLLESAKGVSNV